jgi:hypothetical protein
MMARPHGQSGPKCPLHSLKKISDWSPRTTTMSWSSR